MAEVEFQLANVSDRSHAMIMLIQEMKPAKRPFRFFNIWTGAGEFGHSAEAGWAKTVTGYKPFQIGLS